MEKIDYPNNGLGKTKERDIQAIRGYLNNLADVLNHNFEQIEEKLNELSKQEEG